MGLMNDPAAPSRARRLLLGSLAALAWPAAAQPTSARRITVGVEAALETSGLAPRLGRAFQRDTGLVVDWRSGPSGLLLPQLERGQLNAALTQAPDLELALAGQHLLHDRRPVARTELVLVGPAPRPARKKNPASGDPAGVAGQRDVLVALARIAAAGERGEAGFVSSIEPSGTQLLEQMMWRALGLRPPGPWRRTAGPGAAAVLALARETRGYALVERGVWSALGAGSGLAVLVQGDERLAATYHVMRAFRASHPGGRLLVNWFAGAEGQRVVAGFGHGYRRVA